MNTCLLCRSQADSREHYIPTWLSTACQAKNLQIVRGKSKRNEFTTAQPIGPLKDAKSWLLCVGCNSKLGKNLEKHVQQSLTPYVAPSSVLTKLSLPDTDLLVKWVILRALELSIIAKQSLLEISIGEDIVDICQSVRDGSKSKIWRWFAPSLEAVAVRRKTMGCALSQSFHSSERGDVKSTGRGFWFFLQMNSLGLLLIHAPGAQRNNALGHGLRLFPEGIPTVDDHGIRTEKMPQYENIQDVYSRLTSLNTEL
jgi:hypothetical protein